MNILISSFAHIMNGMPTRSAMRSVAGGPELYLQANDVLTHGQIDSDLMEIDLEGTKTKAILQPGDVVLTNRGFFRAAIFHGNDKTVIPAASLIVIRMQDLGIASPEYLVEYFNSTHGQDLLQRNARGATIKMLSKTIFKTLEILVPPKEIQQKIIEINTNMRQRELLYERKIKLYQQIRDQAVTLLLTAHTS